MCILCVYFVYWILYVYMYYITGDPKDVDADDPGVCCKIILPHHGHAAADAVVCIRWCSHVW